MTPPVKINGLPIVVDYGWNASGHVEYGWRYYPTHEEAIAEGLRIEILAHLRPDDTRERYEARLVKGSLAAPKHLHVIRLKQFDTPRIAKAAYELRGLFFQKGW